MSPKLRALLIVFGVGIIGVLTGKELLTPGPGVTNPQLVDAGILENTLLRLVRCWAIGPKGQVVRRERKALWHQIDKLPIFDDAPPVGWVVAGCDDLGPASGGTSAFVDVTPECVCSSGTSCNATAADGQAKVLPIGVVAGPGYQWTNPVGAGCVPRACIETVAGSEWPKACP